MPQTNGDPWEVATMNELLALARSMEQEAIDGYIALAARMRDMERDDLAAVFNALVAEEQGHLGKVEEWQQTIDQSRSAIVHAPEALFHDEGAGIVAPDMLSAYRAFSMAVRNEERAFVFWTYVAAHAKSDDIRQAAERMAREELGHVAKLRSERRRAFHVERRNTVDSARTDLQLLEMRFAGQLEQIAGAASTTDPDPLRIYAEQARLRADALARTPFASPPLLEAVPETASEQALPLCELLTDCYLDLGQSAPDEAARERAQRFAAELIHCLRALRSSIGNASEQS